MFTYDNLVVDTCVLDCEMFNWGDNLLQVDERITKLFIRRFQLLVC